MSEPTNEQRAEWAFLALERFARATGQEKSGDLKNDRESVVGDLLCNLMHLCERDGIDFDKCTQNARGNYNEDKGCYKSNLDPEQPIPVSTECQFTSHGSDHTYEHLNGDTCKVLEIITPHDGKPITESLARTFMYRVRFNDTNDEFEVSHEELSPKAVR